MAGAETIQLSLWAEELRNPLSVDETFRLLSGDPYPFLLGSGPADGAVGPFTFLGSRPFQTLELHPDGGILLAGGRRRNLPGRPMNVLSRALERFRARRPPAPVPFLCGAVGFLSYDLGRDIERIPSRAADDLPLPWAHLAFYDEILAFDHAGGRWFLARSAPTGERRGPSGIPGRLRRAKGARVSAPPNGFSAGEPVSGFTHEAYRAAVRRAIEYIHAGDVFQVNLSQRFRAPLLGDPVAFHERLLRANPAPYRAFLSSRDWAVASSSPEMFLRLRGRQLRTRPIKGTRPRSADAAEDARLVSDLLGSEKDRAELAMIIDLERNDLGRVALPGTVRVTEPRRIESYASVHHAVGEVAAELPEGLGIGKLIEATFPGGSVTGCPKIRAMEIIEEIEPVRRSLYTGAIGWFSFDGDAELSIAIRTVILAGGGAYCSVGGGIVADSDPEAEYRETLDKGKAIFRALQSQITPNAFND